jgi:hypothetical protein
VIAPTRRFATTMLKQWLYFTWYPSDADITLIRAAQSENETNRRPIAMNKKSILMWVRYWRVSSLNVDARIKTRITMEKARER